MSEQFPNQLVVQAIPSSVKINQIAALFSKYNPETIDGPYTMDTNKLYRVIIQFESPEVAKEVLDELNYYAIMGQEIQIIPFYPNVDKLIEDPTCSVIVHNLDPSIKLKRLHKVMGSFGHVLFCRYLSNDSSGEPRSFVQFMNPAEAANAIEGAKWSNQKGEAIYATHVTVIQPEAIVYLRHIPRGISDTDIRDLLSQLDGFEEVQFRPDGDAIIQFKSQEQSVAAMVRLNKFGFIPNCRLSAQPYVPKEQRHAVASDFNVTKSVFIKSIPEGSLEDSLRSAIEAHVNIAKYSWRDATPTTKCATAIVELGNREEQMKLINLAKEGEIEGFPTIVITPYYPPQIRKKFQSNIANE